MLISKLHSDYFSHVKFEVMGDNIYCGVQALFHPQIAKKVRSCIGIYTNQFNLCCV